MAHVRSSFGQSRCTFSLIVLKLLCNWLLAFAIMLVNIVFVIVVCIVGVTAVDVSYLLDFQIYLA